MVKNMKENGEMVNFMVKVSKHCQMGQYLMENGLKEDQMEWVCVNIQMEQNIQAPGLMVNHMVKVSKFYQMVQNTLVIGLMEKLMA